MATERWLVTGASGQLGGHVVRRLLGDPAGPLVLAVPGRGDTGAPDVAVRRVDLRDREGLRACVADYRPTHVIHLGGMTAVADAFQRPTEAWETNVLGTAALAEAAEDVAARFVFSSTDMVFGGDAAPYDELDLPCPVSQYGRTKFAAERMVLLADRALVVRLPLMFGFPVSARSTTFGRQMATLRRGEPLKLFTDEFRTPISLIDAALAVIDLARSDRSGIIHVAGAQRFSRYELIAECAKLLGIDRPALERTSRTLLPAPEPRPADLSLDDRVFRAAFPHLAAKPLSREALGEP